MKNNFIRMIDLATASFAVNNDPQQLNVNEEVIEQLKKLHPSTLSEKTDENGPYIWVLLIPTTTALMQKFIRCEISETELLNQTPQAIKYEALYLCSALTLPEFRHKGITKQIILEAIKKIRETHPIKKLFVWSFSKEGAQLAESIAKHEALSLLKRKPNIINH